MVETIHLATVAGLISRSNPSTIRDEEDYPIPSKGSLGEGKCMELRPSLGSGQSHQKDGLKGEVLETHLIHGLKGGTP
jgi:hypothetical protein